MQSAVWAAASVLADTMQQPSHFAEDHWRAKSVVELGSGCGLCGLMAAALGARRALLTDLPPLLPLLRRNCDANRHVCGESELSVRSLEWGVTPCGGLLAEGEEWSEGLSEGDQEVSTPSTRGTPLLRRWDVVLGADITPFVQTLGELSETILELSGGSAPRESPLDGRGDGRGDGRDEDTEVYPPTEIYHPTEIYLAHHDRNDTHWLIEQFSDQHGGLFTIEELCRVDKVWCCVVMYEDV